MESGPRSVLAFVPLEVNPVSLQNQMIKQQYCFSLMKIQVRTQTSSYTPISSMDYIFRKNQCPLR